MSDGLLLADSVKMVDEVVLLGIRGEVYDVQGVAIRVIDLPVPVGGMVRIHATHGEDVLGEVVGFAKEMCLVLPLGEMRGIAQGDHVEVISYRQYVRVGDELVGRVINAVGEPLDGKGEIKNLGMRALYPGSLDPMTRPVIDEPLGVGVKAIDAIMSVGKGQRLGIFAGPGVGKSTLLGTMVKHTQADLSIIALVGERGREVRAFVEQTLGVEGMAKSVVICATGDDPALLRIRAAAMATSVAEYFRDEGKDVLLIMDSVTRFCQAQRQVGLASGEPPTTKGYPPSVFAALPRLLERSGRTEKGSITGMYAVLVEGDDMTEPIADAAQGILDGHIHLSRKFANKGHWPAIDVMGSISRVATDVTDAEHQEARRKLVKIVSDYADVEDLVNIGAYASGSNPSFDIAIHTKEMIDELLVQDLHDQKIPSFQETRMHLITLMAQIDVIAQQLKRNPRRSAGAR